jgi:PKD repeat protein
MKGISLSLTCLVAAVMTGCTVHQTYAPPLSGPSELALSVTMTASPDTLVSGGQQQSSISVQARDAGGGPKANQSFQLYTVVDGASVPYGTLSTDRVVTGVDGRATAIYTIPNFTQFDAGTPSRKVSVYAIPVGTDYAAANPHNVQLLVIPPAVPATAPGAPTAALIASTTTAKVGQLVTFNGSSSLAAPGCAIVMYYWNFGDALANEEHGYDSSHAFAAPGTYTVIMGVQDDVGRIGSAFKTIVVTG